MAETEHKTKIVVEGDTSNAQKNLVDLGKTKVPPVKVPVEVEKPTIDNTTVPPVKVPIEVEKPKIEPPKVEPVNIPVNVDSTQIVNAEQNVKRLGDAVDRLPVGLGAVVKGLDWVRAGVSKVMSALGLIGLVISGVTLLYEGFKKLKEKFDEISTAAARMRWATEMYNAALETKRLVGFHEKLAALLKDENDELSKQKSLRDQAQQIADDKEDGKRAADRARQIYEAATPEEEQRLRDQFAAEDERIAAKRKERDRKNRIKDLDEEDSAYTAQANALRGNNAEIGKMIAAREFDRKRAVTDEDRSTIDKELEGLRKRQEANDQAIAQYEREAKFRRDQIAILEGAGTGDGPTAGYWNRKTEQKKRDQEASDKEFEDKQRKSRESDEATRAFVDAYEREQQKEAEAARGRAESALERSYAVGMVSQNRLTALGLGSGVSGNDTMATEMRKVVDLLEKQLVATKENKPEKPGDTATFTE